MSAVESAAAEDIPDTPQSNTYMNRLLRIGRTFQENLRRIQDNPEEQTGLASNMARSFQRRQPPQQRLPGGRGNRSTHFKFRLVCLGAPRTQANTLNLVELNNCGLGTASVTGDHGVCKVKVDDDASTFTGLIQTNFPVLGGYEYTLNRCLPGGRLSPLHTMIPAELQAVFRAGRSRIRHTPTIFVIPTVDIREAAVQSMAEASDTTERTVDQEEQAPEEQQPPVDQPPTAEELFAPVERPTAQVEQVPVQQAAPEEQPPTADELVAPVERPTAQAEAEPQDDSLELQLDVSTETVFVEAGTPTVLFRTMPVSMLDVTRSIPLDATEETEETRGAEDMPVVNLESNPMTVTSPMTGILKEHAALFLSADMGDPLYLEVRRNFAFRDSLQFIRYAQDDLRSPLQLKFTGEEGIDLGGLRREFWTLFLDQACHSALVTGKPGRLSFSKNYIETKRGTFRHLGQLVALSILQDGPGLPIFADVVVNHLLDRTSGLCIDDLPDHLVQALNEMDESSDRALPTLYGNMFEEASAAGLSIPTTTFKRQHVALLKGALVENLLDECRAEMDQFVEGLNTHLVLDVLRAHKNQAFPLLSGRTKEVTAGAVRELLQFQYRTGNARQRDEETAQGFLTFVQATKGSAAVVNGIRLRPKDVLLWLSGAAFIPAIGLHKKIDVTFGEATRVNTCALALILGPHPTATEDIVKYYCELVINSQTFQLQ